MINKYTAKKARSKAKKANYNIKQNGTQNKIIWVVWKPIVEACQCWERDDCLELDQISGNNLCAIGVHEPNSRADLPHHQLAEICAE